MKYLNEDDVFDQEFPEADLTPKYSTESKPKKSDVMKTIDRVSRDWINASRDFEKPSAQSDSQEPVADSKPQTINLQQFSTMAEICRTVDKFDEGTIGTVAAIEKISEIIDEYNKIKNESLKEAREGSLPNPVQYTPDENTMMVDTSKYKEVNLDNHLKFAKADEWKQALEAIKRKFPDLVAQLKQEATKNVNEWIQKPANNKRLVYDYQMTDQEDLDRYADALIEWDVNLHLAGKIISTFGIAPPPKFDHDNYPKPRDYAPDFDTIRARLNTATQAVADQTWGKGSSSWAERAKAELDNKNKKNTVPMNLRSGNGKPWADQARDAIKNKKPDGDGTNEHPDWDGTNESLEDDGALTHLQQYVVDYNKKKNSKRKK